MLTCVVRKAGNVDRHFEWEPGGENVPPVIFGLHGTEVQVRAFGATLEWIKKHIHGIRMSENVKNVVNWVGEDAVFIMNNLPRPVEPSSKRKIDMHSQKLQSCVYEALTMTNKATEIILNGEPIGNSDAKAIEQLVHGAVSLLDAAIRHDISCGERYQEIATKYNVPLGHVAKVNQAYQAEQTLPTQKEDDENHT